MSEELILVFGVILGVGAIGYMLSQAVTVGNLSAAQIAGYAQTAGFTGDDLVTAVAIALAESSGNPEAHGDLSLPGSGSYGLWQIYAHAHPEFGPDFTKLFDPQTNANAAYSVYQAAGSSFAPWSTFKNGAYSAYLQNASDAVSA